MTPDTIPHPATPVAADSTISTTSTLPDSIAAIYNPAAEPPVVTLDDNPATLYHWSTCRLDGDSWERGLTGEQRPGDTRPWSGSVTLLIVLLAMVLLSAAHLRYLLGGFGTEMLGLRRRNNAFDSHTSSETRTLGLLLVTAIVCEGLILGVSINPAMISNPMLTLAMMGLMAGYYLWQVAIYSIVGYTFTDTFNASQWRRGFNYSQAMVGLAIIVPAFAVMFYPSMAHAALWLSAACYLLARLAFLFKGFRIFYNGLPSLIYFILYLCTLEIIPVVIVYSIAVLLNGLLSQI